MYKRCYHKLNFIKIWPEKLLFFEWWSWFKFNNLGLATGANLKFYTGLSKGLTLKVRKFWGLILTFVDVTGGKLVGGLFATPHHPPPISKRINSFTDKNQGMQIKLHLQVSSLNFLIPSHFICLGLIETLKNHIQISYLLNVI